MRIDDLLEHGFQLMMTYGPKALLALAVWVIGLCVINMIGKALVRFMMKHEVDTGDHWGVHFATFEEVKKRFDAAGIGIPFPQMDVHTHSA